MLEVNTSLSPTSILSILKSTGKTVTGRGARANFPRVDALAAVQEVSTQLTPTPTPTGTPPTATPTAPTSTPTSTPTPSSFITVRYNIPTGTDTSSLKIIVFNLITNRWTPLSNLTINTSNNTISGTLGFHCPSEVIGERSTGRLFISDASVSGDILFALATGDLYVPSMTRSGILILVLVLSIFMFGLLATRTDGKNYEHNLLIF